MYYLAIASIVKYHDHEPNGANRTDTTVQGELSKSYWPCFDRHPSSAIDLSPTSIGRQGNTDEPAKLPEGPAS